MEINLKEPYRSLLAALFGGYLILSSAFDLFSSKLHNEFLGLTRDNNSFRPLGDVDPDTSRFWIDVGFRFTVGIILLVVGIRGYRVDRH